MKKWVFAAFLVLAVLTAHAAGIMANRTTAYLEPITTVRCDYEVNICNEVAVVKVTETFRQNYFHVFYPRYIYPLPEDAAVTAMRWFYNGSWHNTGISIQPQNPMGNPGFIQDAVLVYLGEHPYFCDLACSPSYSVFWQSITTDLPLLSVMMKFMKQ